MMMIKMKLIRYVIHFSFSNFNRTKNTARVKEKICAFDGTRPNVLEKCDLNACTNTAHIAKYFY